jgi:hypothetical protein
VREIRERERRNKEIEGERERGKERERERERGEKEREIFRQIGGCFWKSCVFCVIDICRQLNVSLRLLNQHRGKVRFWKCVLIPPLIYFKNLKPKPIKMLTFVIIRQLSLDPHNFAVAAGVKNFGETLPSGR